MSSGSNMKHGVTGCRLLGYHQVGCSCCRYADEQDHSTYAVAQSRYLVARVHPQSSLDADPGHLGHEGSEVFVTSTLVLQECRLVYTLS